MYHYPPQVYPLWNLQKSYHFCCFALTHRTILQHKNNAPMLQVRKLTLGEKDRPKAL